MSVAAKICGLSTPETVDAAVAGGAAFVGFMTYPRSPRHVASDELLAALGARVPRGVIRVGVFVDPDDSLLDQRLATGAIDLLQLHGSETPERVAGIKARTGKPVMKVIKVSDAADVERGIAAFASVADRLMFETAGGLLPGGNAEPFDWTILSGRRVPLPWLLAGGLRPDNLAEAVKVTGATEVDVSSGVESSRGVKSIELIRAFLACATAL
jgi:phosphoribosylanthranilate isomerase